MRRAERTVRTSVSRLLLASKRQSPPTHGQRRWLWVSLLEVPGLSPKRGHTQNRSPETGVWGSEPPVLNRRGRDQP